LHVNLDFNRELVGRQRLNLGILDHFCCQEEVEVRKQVGFLYMCQPAAGSTKIFCMLVPIYWKLCELKLETTGPVNPVLASCVKLFEKIDQ